MILDRNYGLKQRKPKSDYPMILKNIVVKLCKTIGFFFYFENHIDFLKFQEIVSV
jgi:hypothetical protein